MIKKIKNFRKDLYLIFVLSLIVIISIESYLINIPEKIIGGYIAGLIILKLCYSIVASVIFYFFAVHLKESKKRDQILPLLISHLEKLKFLKNAWLSELYFVASFSKKGWIDWPGTKGLITNYYPTVIEIETLARCTPLYETRAKEKNWIERTYRLKNEILPICEEILKLDNNLKPIEILLIGQLNVCDLFSKISQYKLLMDSEIIGNEDLRLIEPELKSFLILFKNLEAEINKLK
ncbi:MAG: hypothetical protein ABI892_18710 [Flavobacterium sp.]